MNSTDLNINVIDNSVENISEINDQILQQKELKENFCLS